jgi:hypothetical protein
MISPGRHQSISECGPLHSTSAVLLGSLRGQKATPRIQDTLKINVTRQERLRQADQLKNHILDKALQGSPPSKREAIRLMRCRNIEDTFSLYNSIKSQRGPFRQPSFSLRVRILLYIMPENVLVLFLQEH